MELVGKFLRSKRMSIRAMLVSIWALQAHAVYGNQGANALCGAKQLELAPISFTYIG